ncbi:hypothetical protein ACTJJY_24710 [Bacillus sp. 22475]|uniref:hypothetical protein n=1 Tax=Bacillus sp. 22475 TaxID=3453925 RepID=UPI003F83709B
MLEKIGLSKIELKRIVTRQMVILFFLPILIAMLHSSVAFMALQHISKSTSIGRNISVLGSSTIVLISFLFMQDIYFFLIRSSYLKSVSKVMYTVEDIESIQNDFCIIKKKIFTDFNKTKDNPLKKSKNLARFLQGFLNWYIH